MTVGADSIRIDMILRRMLANPTHRALAILQLCRPWIAYRTMMRLEQPVIDAEGHEAGMRQLCRIVVHDRPVGFNKTAAVDQDDSWRSHAVLSRLVHIETQLLSIRDRID